jgi:hypothetical protein
MYELESIGDDNDELDNVGLVWIPEIVVEKEGGKLGSFDKF